MAAWRGLDGFEGRASLRAWLYRIATNRCLNALRDGGRARSRRRPSSRPSRRRRPASASRSGSSRTPTPCSTASPTARRAPRRATRPARRSRSRSSPGCSTCRPRQRAVLVLRDVLGFRAAEVAEMLDISEASVNSALQRARAALETRLPAADRERAPLPRSARERELVGRFADAFERGDVDAIVALLTDDAWLTMPPVPLEYQGPAAIARFLSTVPAGGALRALPAGRDARQRPAGVRVLPAGPAVPGRARHGLLVLTLEGDRDLGAHRVPRHRACSPRSACPGRCPARPAGRRGSR